MELKIGDNYKQEIASIHTDYYYTITELTEDSLYSVTTKINHSTSTITVYENDWWELEHFMKSKMEKCIDKSHIFNVIFNYYFKVNKTTYERR